MEKPPEISPLSASRYRLGVGCSTTGVQAPTDVTLASQPPSISTAHSAAPTAVAPASGLLATLGCWLSLAEPASASRLQYYARSGSGSDAAPLLNHVLRDQA